MDDLLNVRSGVAVVSLDHTFAWVDQTFSDITGYSTPELIGKTFESITHPDDLDLDHQLADRLFRGEVQKYSMEKRYLHKCGTIIPIHLSVLLIRDRFGGVLYAVSTVERISEMTNLHVSSSTPLTPQEVELDRIRRAVVGD